MKPGESEKAYKVLNLRKSKKSGIMIGVCSACKATSSNCDAEHITRCLCCGRLILWED